MTDLGRLRRVELRDIWRSEAQDFTPWLAGESNIGLLGEALGIELEVEAVERNVGPFRADILCKDTQNENWVLIENQLERTDHTHLGQLLTYAAGLEAVTVVWISARVADEHRAAMDWLNDITESGVRFFALEVELWKIGDSQAAPKFNVVSKPNDWFRSSQQAKTAIEAGELTPTRKLQLDYWTGVEDLLASRKSRVNAIRPQAYQWMGHSIGKAGVNLNTAMVVRDGYVRVELYLTGPTAKHYYSQLASYRSEIDQQIPDLYWQELPEGNDSRISAALSCDLTDEDDWPRQHVWVVDMLIQFDQVFRPLVAKLRKPEQGEDLP